MWTFGGDMKLVTNLFLRAKHWQIFLLLFGALLVAQMAMMNSIAPTTLPPENSEHIGLLSVMVIFIVCFLGWFWSMGSFLSSILQPTLKMKLGFFRFALVFPAIYIPAFMFMAFSQK